MRSRRHSDSAVLVGVLVLAGSGPLTAGPPAPDLVVKNLPTTGRPVSNKDGNVEVPVRFVVQNAGGQPAEIFKVSVDVDRDGGRESAAPFRATETPQVRPDPEWYAFSRRPLAAGGSIVFTGRVVVVDPPRRAQVALKIVADSCSGEEFMPTHCRVKESTETNNSSRRSVRMP